jgi:hypothetical protein
LVEDRGDDEEIDVWLHELQHAHEVTEAEEGAIEVLTLFLDGGFVMPIILTSI